MKKIEKHADWVETFRGKYDGFTKENVMEILEKKLELYLPMFWKMQVSINVQKREELHSNGS